MASDYNPDTHVKGDDGQIYEKKVVSASGVAAGMHTDAPKSDLAQAMEKAMTKAVQDAHNQGVTDPEEIKARILVARDQTLNG